MPLFRIALANLEFAATPQDSVRRACEAIADAARESASIVCFPECYVPGYRTGSNGVPPPDAQFLKQAHAAVQDAARQAGVAVILGTERIVDGALRIAAMIVNRDGTPSGFQDKVQIAPEEEGLYSAGSGRQVFRADGATFGVVICHEGFRYPETVRAAARLGAQVVFHPHYEFATPGSCRPSSYAEPGNTFHEKAAMCRAAENTCYYATVNYASAGSPTTSAVIRPDGTLECWQPYGQCGLLVADLDLSLATGRLASRLKIPG